MLVVLLALLAISGGWIAWQMAFIVADALDSRWDVLWTFDAFWQLLYLGVLCTICSLWSPSKSNNSQYAYEAAALDHGGSANGDDAATYASVSCSCFSRRSRLVVR